MALPQSSFRLSSSNTPGSVKALSVLLCDKYCVFLFKYILLVLLEGYTMYYDHMQPKLGSALTRLRFSFLPPSQVRAFDKGVLHH